MSSHQSPYPTNYQPNYQNAPDPETTASNTCDVPDRMGPLPLPQPDDLEVAMLNQHLEDWSWLGTDSGLWSQ
jgi:hypothetical protein